MMMASLCNLSPLLYVLILFIFCCFKVLVLLSFSIDFFMRCYLSKRGMTIMADCSEREVIWQMHSLLVYSHHSC